MTRLIAHLEEKLARDFARASILGKIRYRSTHEETELRKLEESIRNLEIKLENERKQGKLRNLDESR